VHNAAIFCGTNETCCSTNDSAAKTVKISVGASGLIKMELPVCVRKFVRRITTPGDATLQEVLKQVLLLVLGK
jgi:hypothetical protein